MALFDYKVMYIYILSTYPNELKKSTKVISCKIHFHTTSTLEVVYLSSLNYGGLNLAVFRQFRHILSHHYFYPP